MTELHVIFGAGPLGVSVVEALLKRGKQVRLVSRSGKVNAAPEGAEVVKGDATSVENCIKICKDATHVYNCLNARDYHKWPEQFPPLQAGVLAGAAAAGAKLVVLENLYMYGPHGGVPLTETMPLRATGPRGATRKRMTEVLFKAHREGQSPRDQCQSIRLLRPRCSTVTGRQGGIYQRLTGQARHADGKSAAQT